MTSAVSVRGSGASKRPSDSLVSPVISLVSVARCTTARWPSTTAAATALPLSSSCAAKGPSGRRCGSTARRIGGEPSGVTTRRLPAKVTSNTKRLSSTRPSDVAAANALLSGGCAAAIRRGRGAPGSVAAAVSTPAAAPAAAAPACASRSLSATTCPSPSSTTRMWPSASSVAASARCSSTSTARTGAGPGTATRCFTWMLAA